MAVHLGHGVGYSHGSSGSTSMGHTVYGYHIRLSSVAGVGTSCVVAAVAPNRPRLRIGFDCGVIAPWVCDTDMVFLSHGHTDHVGAVASHLRHNLLKTRRPRYFVPKGCAAALRTAVQAFRQLDDGECDDEHEHGEAEDENGDQTGQGNGVTAAAVSDPTEMDVGDEGNGKANKTPKLGGGGAAAEEQWQVVGGTETSSSSSIDSFDIRELAPGDFVHVDGPYYILAFGTEHRVPSLGYVLFMRHRLRSSEEERRTPGFRPQSTLSVELVFTGDLRLTPQLLQVPWLRAANVIITELTFLNPDDHARAERTMHLHLDDINTLMQKGRQDSCWVVGHFSRRHSAADVMARVASLLEPETCARICLALEALDIPQPDVTWALHRAFAIRWGSDGGMYSSRGEWRQGTKRKRLQREWP